MSGNSSWGKMYSIWFHSVNVKKIGHNWTQELGSMQYLGYHENILIVLVLPLKYFKSICFALNIKIM